MLSERSLWVGATTVAIALLVVMMVQALSQRGNGPAPKLDEPAPRPAIWRTVEGVRL